MVVGEVAPPSSVDVISARRRNGRMGAGCRNSLVSKAKAKSTVARKAMATTSRLGACGLVYALGITGVLAQSQSSGSEGPETGEPSISSVSIAPTALSPGDAFTATWTYQAHGANVNETATTGDLTTFDIDLDLCVDGPGTCDCGGNSLTPLCPEANGGCVDSDGQYDLSLPDSDADMTAEVGAVYQVRVSLASDPTVFACGSGFMIQESRDDPELEITSAGSTSGGGQTSATASTDKESSAQASLTVTAPAEGLIPGQAFTAQWWYDDGEEEDDPDEQEDGVGDAGDFGVDLYSCADGACADGSCGTFVASLCGEKGCHDPGTGDYDVVIPASVAPGAFSLYVEELGENGPWDCVTFEVSPGPAAPTPQPTSAPQTTSPSPQPTAAAGAAAATPAPVTSVTSVTSSPVVVTPTPVTAQPVLVGGASTSAPVAVAVAGGAEGEPGSPGVPPIPVPAKQVCNASAALEFVYSLGGEDDGSLITVAHASGDRSELGCLTLTMVWEWLQTGPEEVPTDLLYPVDPATGVAITTPATSADLTGVWLLRTSLDITNGVTLELKGAAASGDCDELKISSTSSQIHAVIAYGGNLDIYKTHVQSWDETKLEPHVLPLDSEGDEPRAYVACVSEVVNASDSCPVGAAQKDMGECRMDMEDSELGYLGYYATESYGVTWKVRGLCTDLSNVEIFDTVNVWGNMINCNIHHMWYGMYSYGHQGGIWINNLMHDNHVYGFDPHDDSDYLTIHNNTVYNNGKHGIIASKRCDHLSIRDNKVDESGGSGIILHRSCDDSLIIGNVVHTSSDAGIALMETSRSLIKDNVIADGKWGARLTLGCSDNLIVDNLLENNSQREIYMYEGADEPWVATNININNTFDANTINYVASSVASIFYTQDTVISNNVFSGGEGFFEFEEAYDTAIVGNTGDVVTSDIRVDENSCFTPETPLEPTCP